MNCRRQAFPQKNRQANNLGSVDCNHPQEIGLNRWGDEPQDQNRSPISQGYRYDPKSVELDLTVEAHKSALVKTDWPLEDCQNRHKHDGWLYTRKRHSTGFDPMCGAP